MKDTHPRATPQRVDWLTNLDCFRVAMLAVQGKSNRLMQRRTGFTPSQVAYRLRDLKAKTGIRISDYRNGTSAWEKRIELAIEHEVSRPLRGVLKTLPVVQAKRKAA